MTVGVPKIVPVPPSVKAAPRFMRRRLALLGEIAVLVDELDAELDRIERTNHAPASEREL